MQQTSFPFEVVVHDDASTDGTAAVIREYTVRFPEILKPILQSENQFSQEPGRVTRIAISAAKGKYIAYCEGDDYWTDPLKLQKQVDLLESDPAASGCFHFVQQVYDHSETIGRLFGDHGPKRRFTVTDTISERALFHPASFMFRRSALHLPKWYGSIKSGDMAMFTLVANEGYLACIPDTMAVYRKHDRGITSTSAHLGNPYHLNRIHLWLYVDRHFRYKYHAKCVELMRHHWRHICTVCTPWARLRHLFKLARIHPAWFLRHPAFTLSRLRDCIRR